MSALQQTGVGNVTVTPAAVAVAVAPTVILGAIGALLSPKHRFIGAVVGGIVGAAGTAVAVKYLSNPNSGAST